MGKSLKNNIRSFRYSDEVAEMLDQAEGKTANEKFENLVRTCHLELPRIQSRLDYWNKSIEDLRADYWELVGAKRSIQAKLDSIDRIVEDLDALVARTEGLLSSAEEVEK